MERLVEDVNQVSFGSNDTLRRKTLCGDGLASTRFVVVDLIDKSQNFLPLLL